MTARTPRTNAPIDAIRRFVGVPFRARTYRSLAYLGLSAPLGVTYFIGATFGFALGVGLLITWVGLPILVLTVAGTRLVSGVEALLADRLLGIDASPPAVNRPWEMIEPPGEGFLDSTWHLLRSPTTRACVLLVLVRFVFGLVAFAALVTGGALSIVLVSAPVVYDAPGTTYRIGATVVDALPEAIGLGVVGIGLLLSALHALNALARVGGEITVALLDAAETSS